MVFSFLPRVKSIVQNFSADYPGTELITNAFFTRHRIVSTNAAWEEEESRSCSYLNTIFILERCDYASSSEIEVIIMHELAHQFGADDHYHEEDINGNCINPNTCPRCANTDYKDLCIMNDHRQVLESDTLFCDACMEDMLAHLNSHH